MPAINTLRYSYETIIMCAFWKQYYVLCCFMCRLWSTNYIHTYIHRDTHTYYRHFKSKTRGYYCFSWL